MMTSSNGSIFRVTVLCAGNSPVTDEFPSQRPVTWRFYVFFYMCRDWTNGWVNNRDAGDLGRHHTHYDVIVMESDLFMVMICNGSASHITCHVKGESGSWCFCVVTLTKLLNKQPIYRFIGFLNVMDIIVHVSHIYVYMISLRMVFIMPYEYFIGISHSPYFFLLEVSLLHIKFPFLWQVHIAGLGSCIPSFNFMYS